MSLYNLLYHTEKNLSEKKSIRIKVRLLFEARQGNRSNNYRCKSFIRHLNKHVLSEIQITFATFIVCYYKNVDWSSKLRVINHLFPLRSCSLSYIGKPFVVSFVKLTTILFLSVQFRKYKERIIPCASSRRETRKSERSVTDDIKRHFRVDFIR